MFKRQVEKLPLLVVFSANKRAAVLNEAHEGLGHKGVQATFKTI
jgi:hypothetical protein